jgi:heme-degrading monooxygenase HmoA
MSETISKSASASENERGENGLARTPDPPYWAVVFTSARTRDDAEGYGRMADAMTTLAAEQPGFLGVETARDADGVGITVSYWSTPEAIRAWRENARHAVAQRLGRERWYFAFELRVARVERAYSFGR